MSSPEPVITRWTELDIDADERDAMAETTSRVASPEHAAEESEEAGQIRRASTIDRIRVIANGIYRDDHQLQLVLLAFMLLFYGYLLSVSWRLSSGGPLDLTFNSMLDHLLHGQFDVDPKIVGFEGFGRGGRVYAYWGIWCALLRLPLWIFGRMDVDMTTWSCLGAVCLAGMAKVRTLLLLRRHSRHIPMAEWAAGLMLAYILFGGSQIGYLRISIYQEVIYWAYAFAAVFVYFAMKGLVNRWFNLGTLSRMALFAGLALLTRVPTGMGLLLAVSLLLLVLAVQSGTVADGGPNAAIRRMWPGLAQRRVLIPLGILAVLITVTGIINYFRWDNPVTFANYDLYLANQHFPDWGPRTHTSGSFNLARIPFSLMYYFVPVWALHGSSGQLIFAQTQANLFVRVEVPPSSFFLTDLLPFCFIVLLAGAIWKRRAGDLSPVGQMAAALSLGLLVPCVLMLTYISVTYRYRMDFYPAIDFLAFLGLYATLTDEAMLAVFAKTRSWMTAALMVSIASSFMALSLYDLALSPLGKVHESYHHVVQFFYAIVERIFAFHS